MFKLHKNNEWQSMVELSPSLSRKIVTSVHIGNDKVVFHIAGTAVSPGTESVGSENKWGILVSYICNWEWNIKIDLIWNQFLL